MVVLGFSHTSFFSFFVAGSECVVLVYAGECHLKGGQGYVS